MVEVGKEQQVNPIKGQNRLVETDEREQDRIEERGAVRAACVLCHGTKCPLLTAFFSLSFFSLPALLFSQKGLS